MPSVLEAFESAMMSQAAYIDFDILPGDTLSGSLLQQALVDSGEFTLDQATYFASRFNLVAFESAGFGFQAAVFQDRNSTQPGVPGHFHIAFRGTEPDRVEDYLVDGAMIFLTRAFGQIGPARLFIGDLFSPLPTDLGIFDFDDRVDVTGHSLGGHLAQWAASQYEGRITQGITYNGAGIDGIVRGVREAVLALREAERRFPFNQEIMTNIITETGIEVTPSPLTGLRPGTDQLIYAEPQLSPIANHGIDIQVDSLFVAAALEHVLGEQNFDYSEFAAVARASSSGRLADLEGLINSLSDIVGVGAILANPDSRQSLHAAARPILESDLVRGDATGLAVLAGMGAESIASLAAIDANAGYRVALVNEHAFVLEGVDYGLTFNITGDFDLENFSTEYITDRSAYLAARLSANTIDSSEFYNDNLNNPITSAEVANSVLYRANGQDLTIARVSDEAAAQLRQVQFASAADRTLTGGDKNDSLYGVFMDDGTDDLSGGAGDDYLEGGGGDDVLHAGPGLYDIANGGDGNDTYRFDEGDQTLVIRDSDGSGEIRVQGLQSGDPRLSTKTITRVRGSTTLYADDDGNTYFTPEGSGSLYIRTATGGSIIIESFEDGYFGINLTVGTPDAPPAPTNVDVTYNVDLALGAALPGFIDNPLIWPAPAWASDTARRGDFNGTGFVATEVINAVSAPFGHAIFGGYGDSFMTGDENHNALYDDTYISPSRGITFWDPSIFTSIVGNDVLRGEGGDDDLISHSGDDWLFGGTGDDFLADVADQSNDSSGWVDPPLQTSNDHLFGEQGNDYLIANRGDDLLDGGAGTDELYGGGNDDRLIGGADNDVLGGDTRLNDMGPGPVGPGYGGALVLALTGETAEHGRDVLDGGAGNDIMWGGGNDDVLIGGTGDDRMQGDFLFGYADQRPQLRDHASDPGAIHGDDFLAGGAGDDRIYGGGGDDHIVGGGDDDFLYGDFDENSGTYTLDEAFQGDDLIEAGSGSDWLYGNGGADRLNGDSGNDFLFGGSGDDSLFGGGDMDQLLGDAGDDYLDGGDGVDNLFGGDDDDTLIGGAGNDILVGENGNDTLRGGDGQDQLFGGNDADLLFGGGDWDTLQGGEGNDTLNAGAGGGALFGEAGIDTYIVNRGDGQVQITDADSPNFIRFGTGITKESLEIVFTNGLIFIDYAPGESIAMNDSTFNNIQSVRFADGRSFALRDLVTQFVPGSLLPQDRNLVTEPGVSVADVSLTTINQDLILTYSGQEANWIDIADFAGRGILAIEGVGTDFGLATTDPAIALVNWFQADTPLYVSSVSDPTGGTLTFPQSGEFARNLTGTDEADILAGGDRDDNLAGGQGGDVLIGGAGNDIHDGGLGSDLMSDDSGNDTYLVALDGSTNTIDDNAGGGDRVVFSPGILPTDLTLTVDPGGLVVVIGPEANNDTLVIEDWKTATSKIESFEFADGTVWDLATIEGNITGNRPPAVSGTLPDQDIVFDTPFSIEIPDSLFSDPEDGTNLSLSILVNGSPVLPAWMSFDAQTGILSGSPTETEAGTFTVEVTATDSGGLSNSTSFDLIQGATIVGTDGDDDLFGGDTNDTLIGLAGNDGLTGRGGDDLLIGGEGRDRLRGSGGNDIYRGGPGDDDLYSESGDNVFEFEVGSGADDFIDQGAASHTFRFGEGIESEHVLARYGAFGSIFNLRIFFNPADASDNVRILDVFDQDASRYTFEFADGATLTLPELLDQASVGSDGPDILNARNPGDVLVGGFGMDQLWAQDYVPGPNGEGVTLDGGQAEDRLIGGLGDDTIFGGPGNDDIDDNEEGNDFIDAGDGRDSITTRGGQNQLFGGAGDDRFFNFRGDDTIDGGPGNDRFNLSSGNDRLLFDRGAGYDRINALGNVSTTIEFVEGSGITTSEFVFERFENSLSLKYGSDQLLIGGWFNEATPPAVTFVTFSGSTRIESQISDFPIIDALANPDPSNLAPTRDTTNLPRDVIATEGVPFSFTLPADLFSDPDGDPLVLNPRFLDSWLTFDPATGTFSGTPTEGAFNRSITVVASDPDGDSVAATFGLDVVNTNTAPQVGVTLADVDATVDERLVLRLSPAAFIDEDIVNEGPVEEYDELTYSATLAGGQPLPAWLGFDPVGLTLVGTPPAAAVGNLSIELTATDLEGLQNSQTFTISVGGGSSGGGNTLIGTPGDDVLVGGAGVDEMFGGEGNDTLRGNGDADSLFGEAGDDLLVGGEGADLLDGGEGNDDLQGEAGDDNLSGAAGDDVLAGGAGADTLDGGAGADTLIGGDGADVYTFNRGDGDDLINNASTDSAVDRLVIGSGITSNELVFVQVGDDLSIIIPGETRTVTLPGTGTVVVITDPPERVNVQDWFLGADFELDFVETSDDGVQLSAADINTMILQPPSPPLFPPPSPPPPPATDSFGSGALNQAADFIGSFMSAYYSPVHLGFRGDTRFPRLTEFERRGLHDNVRDVSVEGATVAKSAYLPGSGPKLSPPREIDPDLLTAARIDSVAGNGHVFGSEPRLIRAATGGGYEVRLPDAEFIDVGYSEYRDIPGVDEFDRVASQFSQQIAALVDEDGVVCECRNVSGSALDHPLQIAAGTVSWAKMS